MTGWRLSSIWTFYLFTLALSSKHQDVNRKVLQEVLQMTPIGNTVNSESCQCVNHNTVCSSVLTLPSSLRHKFVGLCPEDMRVCCKGFEEGNLRSSDVPTVINLEEKELGRRLTHVKESNTEANDKSLHRKNREQLTEEKEKIPVSQAYEQSIGSFETDDSTDLTKGDYIIEEKKVEFTNGNSSMDYKPKLVSQLNKLSYDEEILENINPVFPVNKINVTVSELMDICINQSDLTHNPDHITLCNLNHKHKSFESEQKLSWKSKCNLNGYELDSLMKEILENRKVMDKYVNFGSSDISNGTLNKTKLEMDGNFTRNICAVLSSTCEKYCSGNTSDLMQKGSERKLILLDRYQPIDLANIENYIDGYYGQLRSRLTPQKGVAFTAFYWAYVTAFLYAACYLAGFAVSQFSVPGLVMKIILIQYFPDIIKFPVFQAGDLLLSSIFSLIY